MLSIHTKPSCNSNNKLAFLQHKIKDNELLLCSLPSKKVQIKKTKFFAWGFV